MVIGVGFEAALKIALLHDTLLLLVARERNCRTKVLVPGKNKYS